MILAALTSAWVTVYAGAASLAAMRAGARRSGEAAGGRAAPVPGDDVVLVRPLAGPEPGLADRLRSTGGATFVIFAVGAPDDGAARVASDVSAELRARGVEAFVVITGAAGPNHKADQLARALATPRAPARRTLVVADSDVEIGRDAVTRLLRAMGDADAIWAPPVELGNATTWGDRASHAVLDASLHSFPLLAGIDRGGLVGKLFAVRRRALEAIGGFAALTTVLGEDMELSRRLRRTGARVIVAPFVAHAMASQRRLGDVVARYGRWLLMVRAQRAILLPSYPLLMAPAPLFAALLAYGVARQDLLLTLAACAGLLVRLAVALAARALAGARFAPLTAVGQSLLADGTLLAALVCALSTRDFTWRGRRLAITKAGAIEVRGRASGGKHADEEALGQSAEEARGARDDGLEPVGHQRRPRLEGGVDASELALDSQALEHQRSVDVALPLERLPNGDPQVGVLRAAEDVAKADREHHRVPRDARDLRGAGEELERAEGRPLAPLGEDPESASRGGEQSRGVTDRAGAVGGIVEVDAERTDPTEEGYASQVRRIHHRVAVGAEQELGDVEGHQRVPPRRVVGDEEQRGVGQQAACALPPADEDATERAPDARAGVASKPRVEPSALGGLDHEVTS